MTQECLLGADFLRKYACIVDIGKQCLLAGEESVPLHGSTVQELGSCHVSVAETTVIPGQCQVVLPATLQRDAYPGTCVRVVEPELKFTECHGLHVARSLSSSQGEIWVQVLNPSPASITVKENEKIGQFQLVEEADVVHAIQTDSSRCRKLRRINLNSQKLQLPALCPVSITSPPVSCTNYTLSSTIVQM